MICVYSAADPADAHLKRALLDEHGIEATIQGESLWGGRGALPVTPDSAPTLWVREEDAVRARAVLEEFEQRQPGVARD